jgi:hypothetical protein
MHMIILNWQRPLWKGYKKAAKRSDRWTNLGCNTHTHGNNRRNFPVWLSN